jgi:hypothetical protein
VSVPVSAFTCRCTKWDSRCAAQATQEDMRCEACREGCAWMRQFPLGTPLAAIEAGSAAPQLAAHVVLRDAPGSHPPFPTRVDV